MNFGTVGTSWITNSFINASEHTGKLTLKGVYSRSIEQAKEIADQYDAPHTFDTLEEMAACEDIDLVYIASPNSLHFEHAKLFLRNKKHVICEKPIFSNTREFDEAHEVAEENGVYLLEAMRNIHSPNVKTLKDNLNKAGKIRSAIFHYIQYSSRYDSLKSGETPNIFSPEFSGGVLVDLGVYPISLAVHLFGEPEDFSYHPVMLESGVDGNGTMILNYGDFVCTVLCSKISHSFIPSEIQGEQASFVLDHVAPINELTLIDRKTKEGQSLGEQIHENDMIYEIDEFTKVIAAADVVKYKELITTSRTVLKITETARKQNGITFDSERKS